MSRKLIIETWTEANISEANQLSCKLVGEGKEKKIPTQIRPYNQNTVDVKGLNKFVLHK